MDMKQPTAAPADATDRVPGSGLASLRVPLDPYPIQVGPSAHLAGEAERLSQLSFEHFDVRRMGATIGAEITGVDITRDLPDEAIAELSAALAAFKVIFFREQPLTAERHVAFARRFGDLESHPFFPANTGEPALVRFEKSAELSGYENAGTTTSPGGRFRRRGRSCTRSRSLRSVETRSSATCTRPTTASTR